VELKVMLPKGYKMLKCALVLLAFMSSAMADEPPQAVVTMAVQESHPVESITGVGTFAAYHDVILTAEIAGRIETIHFKEGDHVKPNQKLFSFSDKEQIARVKKAEASLELSQNFLKRIQGLKNKEFISQHDLEKAQTQVKLDEAEFALAKETLAKTQILAPFDGVLSNRKVSKGSRLIEGDTLVRIQDLTPIRLTFRIPQKEISVIKAGEKVTATTDVYPDKTFEGKIEAIEPSVNEESRSVAVYATFENNDELLIPGLYAHARIDILSNSKPALFIPEQALVIRPDGSYVFKKVGSKVVLTKITLGKRLADQAEVLIGLQKGDEIVLEGQDKIHDGSPIIAEKSS